MNKFSFVSVYFQASIQDRLLAQLTLEIDIQGFVVKTKTKSHKKTSQISIFLFFVLVLQIMELKLIEQLA